jgi:hypothetical protein
VIASLVECISSNFQAPHPKEIPNPNCTLAPPHLKGSSAGLIVRRERPSATTRIQCWPATRKLHLLCRIGTALPKSLLGHGLTDKFLLSNQSSLKIIDVFSLIFPDYGAFCGKEKISDDDVGNSGHPQGHVKCQVDKE